MDTTNNELIFRTYNQYKKHFAPSEKKPDYSGKDPNYIIGAEIARKAFESVEKELEEEKKKAPWEKKRQDD